jgi:hypothetical protein
MRLVLSWHLPTLRRRDPLPCRSSAHLQHRNALLLRAALTSTRDAQLAKAIPSFALTAPGARGARPPAPP